MIKEIQKKYSNNSREHRAKLFAQILLPQESDRILDLGGGNGSHINKILHNSKSKKVTVADISADDLKYAEKEYGYETRILNEGATMPFAENEFDIVFCNSVIEHVTVPKAEIWTMKNTKKFKELSATRQHEFAAEISRISRSYFVQTPYKYFIIESHTWLPGIIAIMPRSVQISIIRFFNKFWPKKTSPDWNLLTYRDMKDLFPDAKIYREKSFGLTKSLIAIKTKSNQQ